jgi:hypothetical protein
MSYKYVKMSAQEANDTGLRCPHGHTGQWRELVREGRPTTRVCRVCLRRHQAKALYGMTKEEFEELFENHDGTCDACGEEAKLNIDHCHTTGKIRGLLCYRCNTIAASLENDKRPDVQEYLDRHGI